MVLLYAYSHFFNLPSSIRHHLPFMFHQFMFYYGIREWKKKRNVVLECLNSLIILNAWDAWMRGVVVMLWGRIICWLLRHLHCLQYASASLFRTHHRCIITCFEYIVESFSENFHPLFLPDYHLPFPIKHANISSLLSFFAPLLN